ncbi:MAG: ATP-binding protein [Chloroherpetonaceae bacterium]|nr:ATP-binding protein [Chloroherpetonaceae bacterium]
MVYKPLLSNLRKFWKNFRFQFILRLLFLCLLFIGAYSIFITTDFVFTPLLFTAFGVIQLWLLIRYVERTNRDLTRLLDAILYEDFSQQFKSHTEGEDFSKLYESFNRIIERFRNTRKEKEASLQFLETTFQHISTGLIAVNRDGTLELINNAAKRLFQLPSLRTISGLSHLHTGLDEKLLALKSGEKMLVNFSIEGDHTQLLFSATRFTIDSKEMILFAVQNIQSELDEKELESWQKLIRILTHEMMNSITPISSLAETMNRMIKQASMDKETLDDLLLASETIAKRSNGLLEFVESYRNLTKIPPPKFSVFPLYQIMERLQILFSSSFQEFQLQLSFRVEPASLELIADQTLIEQVLINLITNSRQAIIDKPNGAVWVRAFLDSQSKVIIEVEDNGIGMSKELQERIFIPFFTTKPNGSGIGLSLARQIMRLHNGNIRVRSTPEKGTLFILRF